MQDLHNKKWLIGTSGGINSAAVIVKAIELIQKGIIPSELHLLYVHINQHSFDTEPFVHALVAYCKHHFERTIYVQHNQDVLNFFEDNKMIPHPTSDSCTRILKTIPIFEYKQRYGIEIDFIGYVNSEKQRVKGIVSGITGQEKEEVNADYYAQHGLQNGLFEKIYFPIYDISNDDCFGIVKDAIGWYPAIYDILWTDERILPFVEKMKNVIPEDARQIIIKYATQGYGRSGTKRVFNHNNCLPCKNMQIWQFWLVLLFFPKYFEKASALSVKLNKYYGRNEHEYNESIAIYTSFGREDYEVGFKEQSCGVCAQDG